MEKFLRFKTRKKRRQFVFFRHYHRWLSGATVVVMSETASINIISQCSFLVLGFSLFRLNIARESHRRSSSSASSSSLTKCEPLRPVTLAIYSEVKIFAFFSLLTVVYLALWLANVFSHFLQG